MRQPIRAIAAATASALLACGLAVAAAAPPPGTGATTPVAASASLTAAVLEAPAAPAGAGGAAPEQVTPYVADFDGDARSDVLWYGPGDAPDHLWLGRPDGAFYGVPLTVAGTYEPVVGDFDGDGRADVFWYATGEAGDVVWYGGRGGRFTGRTVTATAAYDPFPGDFDGDGRTDIFWYAPGPAGDAVWYGTGTRSFVRRPASVTGSYRPLVADFDGDRRTDVFWYGLALQPDVLWYGGARGTFRAGGGPDVDGVYEPVVGDFDGDGPRDILWYGVGVASDVLWYGRARRGFAGRGTTVDAAGAAVVRDFDRDGRHDVLVHGAGPTPDEVHYGRRARGFDAKALDVGAAYQPVAADFGGDGRGDVFWWAPGDGADAVWSGHGRSFAGRSTTIDIAHTRALPLRPETIRDAYLPYGFMAHAMGSIDLNTYTNSLDAFLRNYERGHRIFEADQVVLADGTVFVAHDGTEESYGLGKRFKDAVWADLEGKKFQGKYTALRAQDLLALMQRYPDAYFVLDFKADAARAFATYVRLAGSDPALVERLIPHVADPAMLAAMRRAYPLRNYIVALYRTQVHGRLDDPEVVDWVRRERVPAVMMWQGLRDRSLTLGGNVRQGRRYTPGFVADLKAAGSIAYVHTVNDKERAKAFWAEEVALYTDTLFPPLDGPASMPAPLVAPWAPGFVPDEG